MSRAFVALGANLGDRASTLDRAIAALDGLPSTRVIRRARIIETDALLPPGDPTPQPRYLNTVVELDTGLEPAALLAELKAVETRLGRTPAARWAPRVIDLDLLLWGDRVEPAGGAPPSTPLGLNAERGAPPSTPLGGLTLPHPSLHLRRFVLEPLAELAPDLVHPVLGKTIAALLAEIDVQSDPAAMIRRGP